MDFLFILIFFCWELFRSLIRLCLQFFSRLKCFATQMIVCGRGGLGWPCLRSSQGIMDPVGVEIEMRNEMWSWELLRGLRRNRFFTSEEKMWSTILWESEGFTFTLRRWKSLYALISGQTPGQSIDLCLTCACN